ncbi:hypothetical protein HME9304_01799 [Flagellimonas maritima]|uniref:Uncharacterized protein n=1 Tax=Flagellimonas maritima TaxID=1383885 RepID=A0A2Z4LT82_9FLAO|nr:hypothetical protein [Allomuricauda aurantiaca]AWX44794.1 hypothetical protein HME9304_01799 [Allomuricauda aurantiaca]
MNRFKIVFLACIAFIFMNCKENSSSSSKASMEMVDTNNELLGEYSTQPDGAPEFRISKTKDIYYGQILDGGKWSDPLEITSSNNKELVTLFGDNMDNHVITGLTNSETGFGIFKVDSEFKLAGDKMKSDYLAIFLFPLEVYKL